MLFVGVIHIVLPILMILYILFAPTWLDFYAFLYVSIMSLHWVVYNGECIISYIYKKYKYHSYHIGSSTELEDIDDFLKHIEHKYDWSYDSTRSSVSMLNMFAIIGLIARFIVLGTIKPLWTVWVYAVTTFLWNQWFRRKHRLSIVDVVYAVCLLVVISEVILTHK